MSEEFYNRSTLSGEENRTVLSNSVDNLSHRHGCQYSSQANASEVTAANSRPYRIDNRVERTEVNLHLKHRTPRRSTSSESASSRGRHRANDQNRHLVHTDDDLRTYRTSSSGSYEGEERRSHVFSNANECGSGAVLNLSYMPEIPRATPASNEQAVVVGAEISKALVERMNSYADSEWNDANLSPSLTKYTCEGVPYANYSQSSSKQAQLCPHVKGQQQEGLREDNNNVSSVSFTDRDDERYDPSSVKYHFASRCTDRYTYHPGELERQHRTDDPPSNYYYGIQTENMMRWKNRNREKNGRQIPGAYAKNEKHWLSKSLPKNSRYSSASDRNINSSDSESGPSSSDREVYCFERTRKKRVKKKGNYRTKHYIGESDPSEHSDPGYTRYNEDFPSHICCSSADCDYEQQRSRLSVYGFNNRKKIMSKSLTSVSSIDDETGASGTSFTFNRISPRGKGKSRISKINVKSFSTVQLNPSRLTRATSSTSDIGIHDGAHSRLYAIEKNGIKSATRKTTEDILSVSATVELSDSSCTSPSLKKSPFNSHIRGRKSSISGGETTPSTTPVPRICTPEIVDDKFQAPASRIFKTICSPGSQNPSGFISDEGELNTSTEEGAKELKNLIENLEKDVESEVSAEIKRPDLLEATTAINTENDSNDDIQDVTSPESMVVSPTVSKDLYLSNEDDLPLMPGGGGRMSSFPFGKDTPYSIQKTFVILNNIQEEDEAGHSDGGTGQFRRRRESVTKRKMSKEYQGDSKETEGNVVTSLPIRRPSYVQAQSNNPIAPEEKNNLEPGSRTEPNGKENHVYCKGEKNENEQIKPGEESDTKASDDNENSRRRPKKIERPQIPSILMHLDKALDELFDDVKNQQANGVVEAKKPVSRQESAPQLSTNVAVSDEYREPRKRSNSIDDPSTTVKLIASEADSTYMQRADGKVERRHEKNEQNDIDKSLEILDELVVELSEKPRSQERPALSRNVDGKSAGSASDVVMSPCPSQTSINSEKSTSGSEHIGKDVGVSSLSEIYPSRYHSDPTPRVKEDYTTIQETITEYDIKARNSNSEPAINGKLLEQAADLAKAKAAEREENAEQKNNIEHATSSPADLASNAQPQQKLRRRESEKARRRQAAKVAAQIEANAKETKHDDGDADGESGGKTGDQPITEHHTWPRTKAEPETGETQTGKKKKASKSEMRWHVVQNLIETEQSYVQALQYLVKEYMNPLRKSEGIVEPALVNEMFYEIPEILKYHEGFLKQLAVRVQDWSDNSKLGDIFVSAFTKCLLVDAYSQFINNFLRARTAVRSAAMAKPGFLKYCEQRSRDHKEKLTLQDLMIMPVQRIPRYVLIITDLLKYTPAEHPDHGNLLSGLGEIKTLAERMNKGEQEIDQAEKEAERLRDMEASIEGISGLVLPRRKYKRQDLVAEMKGGMSKKDRCLFLFSDLLVCVTVKRKQTSLRRGSLSLFSGQSAAEMNKYKYLWQSPLDNVELVTTDGDLKSPVKNPDQTYREKLEQDLNTVSTISKLTESVSISHQMLDDAIRDLASELNRLLVEHHTQRSSNATFMSYENTVVLNVGSREPEKYMFVFLSKEIKSSWEAYFLDAKQQLAYTKDSSPNFQNAIPINKSRSGLQFTCASPTVAARLTKRGTHCGSGDLWVASSDGCVGQVSMLSPLREFEQGTTYSPCQARILSISPVPGWKLAGINTTNVEYDFKDPVESNNSTIRNKLSGYHSDENIPSNRRSVATSKAGREEIIAFDSSTDDDDMGDDSYAASPSPPSFDGRLSPEGSSLGTAGSLDGDLSSDGQDDSDYHENQSTDDEGKSRRRSEKKDIDTHCDDIDEANQQPTVWMGAEDGYIYIFPVTSAVKQRRNKTKIQKGSPVQCILYVENQVFVGLANGDLCVYKRSPNYTWEINTPRNITISSNARITCMTAVLGRLWVGCNNQVVVVNTTTLEIETRFNASIDSSRSLHAMASSGMGVWISVQSLSVIRLYHASTFEHLADVDTKDAVHKMLAGSDAIIKQHKAACLRVTALLTCKDLLWIGTSAGVVLTLPLPIIAPNATSVQAPLDVSASSQGHTGHVRFLTAVEIGKPEDKDEPSSSQSANRSPRRAQLNIEKANLSFPSENIFIISGGDGYEDFKSTANESAGREDSTNHLLIWKV